MIIHGKQLIVKKGGTTIAVQKSCEIDVRSSTLQVSSPSDGAWDNYFPGRKSWTMTCNTLLSNVASNVNMVGTTVTVSFGTATDYVSGTAIITAWKSPGTIGNLAQAVASFLGSGPLTTTVNPST